MKKKFAMIFTFLAAILTSASLFADQKGFTIKNYRFQGVLHENNVMEVLEIIDVDFNERRHGIYRNIPVSMDISYNDDFFKGDYSSLNLYQEKEVRSLGYTTLSYRNKLKNVRVIGDAFETKAEGSQKVIKIGRESELLIGLHQYKIQYELMLADDRLNQGDIFYYAVLGSQWDTTIDRFEFEIDFEKPIDVDSNFYVMSGYIDNYANDLGVKYQLTENKITGYAVNIKPYQAISLRAELPQGYFHDAYNPQTSPIILWIFLAFLVASSAVILLLALKTPHEEPVQTVEFYPPEGIASAEVGFIIDHSADNIDLLSLIPYFAKKGYLKITEIPKRNKDKVDHLELTKLKNIPENAPDYQQTVFYGLFDGGTVCDMSQLDERFGRVIRKAKTQISGIYTDELSLYKNAGKKVASVLFLSIAAAVFARLNVAGGISAMEMFLTYGVLLVFGLILNGGNRTKHFEKKIKKAGRIIISIIGAAVLFFVSTLNTVNSILPVWCVYVANFVPFAAILFTKRFEQMTDFNIAVTGKLLGFRSFIENAELPKLKELLNQNPEYFYDVLPYAMVFKLTGKWASQFTDLKITEPEWYHSCGTHMFNPIMFSDRLSSHMSQSFSHAQAELSRAESKSSGHGHSGGGGGGGGGGSW